MIDIQPASSRVLLVSSQQLEAYASLTPLGIPYLDHALYGLINTDLMLIGAKSGVGKTGILTEIAKNSAMNKKRVLFFALEAEENEIEMRLLYQIEARLFFNDEARDRGVTVNYRKWRLGMLDVAFGAYKPQALEIFKDRFSTLTTVYRSKVFGYEELWQTIEMCGENTDIVLLDHIHYMDLGDGKDGTNEKQSKLIKKIRDLNLFAKIPFVCAGHVRKDTKGIVPAQEDFMGSSDIYKNATAIVMITPKPGGYIAKNQMQETLITIPKGRTGGFGDLAGVTAYSVRHQGYLPAYRVGRIVAGERYEDINESEYPDWAVKTTKL